LNGGWDSNLQLEALVMLKSLLTFICAGRFRDFKSDSFFYSWELRVSAQESEFLAGAFFSFLTTKPSGSIT